MPKRHARAHIVAAVTAPAAVRRTLKHVGALPGRAPPSRARELMFEDGDDCIDEPT